MLLLKKKVLNNNGDFTIVKYNHDFFSPIIVLAFVHGVSCECKWFSIYGTWTTSVVWEIWQKSSGCDVANLFVHKSIRMFLILPNVQTKKKNLVTPTVDFGFLFSFFSCVVLLKRNASHSIFSFPLRLRLREQSQQSHLSHSPRAFWE